MLDSYGPRIRAWTQGVEFEQEAFNQVYNVAGLPFIHKHVAVMPDVHWGIGATVGSVIPTKGAIIPAAVGVDIGCGMIAQRLDLRADDLPDDLRPMQMAIEKAVPVGRTHNGSTADRGAWGCVPREHNAALAMLSVGRATMLADHPKIAHKRWENQFGTLGTGNHFIEICLDQDGFVWVMLHSGSRGQGNAIGRYFISLAREDMRKWFVNLPDENLAYIPEGTEHFKAYWFAVKWAQRYASISRELMLDNVLGVLRVMSRCGKLPTFACLEEFINCHHNYVDRENHYGSNVFVTRKGAVRAREGDRGIIPGSMGARSYIVRGKGNRESFTSCSHGAGRRMSRKKARDTFTTADHEHATLGIACRKDSSVLDETPGAYKDIDAVMAAQQELVEVEHTLKQVVCVKG